MRAAATHAWPPPGAAHAPSGVRLSVPAEELPACIGSQVHARTAITPRTQRHSARAGLYLEA